MVLPPLSLDRQVRDTVDHSHRRQGSSDLEVGPDPCDEPRDAEGPEEPEDGPAVAMSADGLPDGHPAHLAVERQGVASEHRHERPEPAAPAEPSQHGCRHDEPSTENRARSRQGRPPGPPRPQGARRRAPEPEQPREGLDHHARAEGEPAPPERRERAAALPGPGHAPGPRQQEDAEEEVALAGAPGPARQVEEGEDESGRDSGPAPAEGGRVGDEEPARQREPAEIEEAPHHVARPHGRHQRPVQEVDAGHVHVEDVAVRHGALGQQPADVVEQRRVVDQRPAQRPPAQVGDAQRASDRNRLQSPARRTG